jgi:serine/threonine-protein kinase
MPPPADAVEALLCPACRRLMHEENQSVPGYHLLRELGRGGMGVVYLAARDADARLVALKTITPSVAVTPTEVQRFLREARILKQLDHPNIVHFLDMNGAPEQLWFAMEYVPGTDAHRLLKEQGPLPVPRAVGLVCQLLEALEYAHARRFVHRDIKPSNLLVTQRAGRETAVLADFGLARVYQASTLSKLTLIGDKAGAPPFMAPEQITHYRDVQPPADQYSAGMTLYNLLTGRWAFAVPSDPLAWFGAILEDEPTPVQQHRPDVPKRLAAVIHRTLAKEPGDRFPDVRALRQALQPWAG